MSQFAAFSKKAWFIFVNDGSQDDTAAVIEKYRHERMTLLDLKHNVGKAEAIRQGVLFLREMPFLEDMEWFGYWDADLSTPLYEMTNFLAYAGLYRTPVDAIWGSRVDKLGSHIRRHYSRHIAGRVFATAGKLLLNIGTYDSQCGAKLFRKDVIRVFEQPFVSRWLFDVELLLRLGNASILEYPLREWKDVPGGKLSVLKEIPRTVIDLLRIRHHYRELLRP